MSGPVFLGISSLQDGRLDLSQSAFVSEEDFQAWTRRVTPRPDDVVFSYETRLGEAAIIPEGLRCSLGRRLALMRPNTDRIQPRYLLYYFLGPEFQEVIRRNTVHGSTVDRIMLRDFPDFPVALPAIAEQRGIAATLGALDDKIESNRRAIELTQALSRWTYVGWRAVHPNTHDTTFGEFADVFGGATPKTSEPGHWDGDIAWATPTDITALTAPYLFGTARMITKAGLASTSATLHPAGTIFMTSRATIGSFAVAHVPAATNQGFIAVQPRKPEHRWFLFAEMRARVPEMLDRANGSTFMELSRGNFKLMPLGVPDEAAIAGLDSDLAPLHTKAAQLDRESSRLAKLRDTLLPELLSGRIRVPEAHETVAEIAASV